MFFAGGAELMDPSGTNSAPLAKTETSFGHGLRPGVRRVGPGWAESEGPSRWRASADLDGLSLCEQVGADAGMWAGTVLSGGGEPVAFPRSGNLRGECGEDVGPIFRRAESGGTVSPVSFDPTCPTILWTGRERG